MEIVHARVRGRAVGKGLVEASTSLAAYPTGPMGKGQRWYRALGLLHSDTPSYMVRRIVRSLGTAPLGGG
jgi:hypothetical protein